MDTLLKVEGKWSVKYIVFLQWTRGVSLVCWKQNNAWTSIVDTFYCQLGYFDDIQILSIDHIYNFMLKSNAVN